MQIHVTTRDKIAVCIFSLAAFTINSFMASLRVNNHDIWTVFSITVFAMFIICKNYLKQRWFFAGMIIIIVFQSLLFIVFEFDIGELPPYGFISLGSIYAVTMGSILEVSRRVFRS